MNRRLVAACSPLDAVDRCADSLGASGACARAPTRAARAAAKLVEKMAQVDDWALALGAPALALAAQRADVAAAVRLVDDALSGE